MNKFGLWEKMDKMNHSQRSIAMELNISKNTINSWMNNKSSITADNIEELCLLLQITDPVEIVNIFLPRLSQTGI